MVFNWAEVLDLHVSLVLNVILVVAAAVVIL